MNFKTNKNKYSVLILLSIICTFYLINAQDSKPKVKPKTTKPATTTKPPAVKSQPKTNTTQIEKKYSTVTDIDGNIYKTVKIGNQIWMAENLKTTRYNDGTPIPNVTDNNEWSTLTTGAYCYYDNYNGNNDIYGKLYNQYAVGTGKLGPKGWHVPSDIEWLQLLSFLAGGTLHYDDIIKAAEKMRNTSGWPVNKNGNNNSGFSGLPSGDRTIDGNFYNFDKGFWWTSENYNTFTEGFVAFSLDYYVTRDFYHHNNGLSVRCIKD